MSVGPVSQTAAAPRRRGRARIAAAGAIARRMLPLALLVALVVDGAGCEDDAPPATGPDVPAATPARAPALTPVDVADPVGQLAGELETRTGWCVQIRSVDNAAEARELAARIEEATRQPVALFEADLQERGTWYRLCVGALGSRREGARKAHRWTSKKGELAPFMEKVQAGQARYFVKERRVPTGRRPTEAQARLLLAAAPDETRPVVLAEAGPERYLAATSTEAGELVLVTPEGELLVPPSGTTPGCVPCRAALKDEQVTERRAWRSAELLEDPGEELLVEEVTSGGSRFLVVLAQGPAGLTRRAAFWLGRHQKNLEVQGQAEVIDADGEPGFELAVVHTEVPVLAGRICDVRTRVSVYDLKADPPVALDEDWLARGASAGDEATERRLRSLTAALDRLGDPDQASRLCRAAVTRFDQPALTRHCMKRVGTLLKSGDSIAAVNAAGLLAEVAEPLRPAVATPFFEAAQAVEAEPGLTAVPEDCVTHALIAQSAGRTLEESLRLAEAARAARTNLADVHDAVYVTARRDFGPQTPVGRIVGGWLTRLKDALPARYAAVEALLATPPAPGSPP